MLTCKPCLRMGQHWSVNGSIDKKYCNSFSFWTFMEIRFVLRCHTLVPRCMWLRLDCCCRYCDHVILCRNALLLKCCIRNLTRVTNLLDNSNSYRSNVQQAKWPYILLLLSSHKCTYIDHRRPMSFSTGRGKTPKLTWRGSHAVHEGAVAVFQLWSQRNQHRNWC